ncbi:MAG: MFS transporter [Dehalococcoidia bacterium]
MAVTVSHITAAARKLQALRALRHKNYRWFWMDSVAQAAGMGTQTFILGWLTLELTGSSAQLGLVMSLNGLSSLIFMLVGGLVADRMDRRKLLISTRTGVTVLVLGLATLSVTGLIQIWHLYLVSIALGIIQAVNSPTRTSMVTDLVSPEDIMNAVALNQLGQNAGRIVGPATAGFIIEYTGIGAALYFNAACYAIGIVGLALIERFGQDSSEEKSNMLRDFWQGLRYFGSTPVVYSIIVIGFFFGFFGLSYQWVMPAIATEVLKTGAAGTGLLITAASVGSVVNGFILASLGNFRKKNWLLLGTVLTFEVALFMFAWSHWYLVSWILLFGMGLGSRGYIAMGTTVLQLTTPSEMQGRVMSLWIVGGSFSRLGALPLAIAGAVFGWSLAVAGGAVICLVVTLWLGVIRPPLRRVDV